MGSSLVILRRLAALGRPVTVKTRRPNVVSKVERRATSDKCIVCSGGVSESAILAYLRAVTMTREIAEAQALNPCHEVSLIRIYFSHSCWMQLKTNGDHYLQNTETKDYRYS